MSLSAEKISDLPAHLQSRILESFLPPTIRSIKPSLDFVCTFRNELPNDLLAIANSSSRLREAVIDVLAARAQLLNTHSVSPIYEWIATLRDTVKGVSLRHSWNVVDQISREEESSSFGDSLCALSLRAFKALSAHYIRLQVLDVHKVPFHLCGRPEQLQHAFVKALEASAPSLREIAVRVTPICAKALSQVTLPKLEVAQIVLHEVQAEHFWILNDLFSVQQDSGEAFMEMLCTLEGHADRARNKTTLRELNLIRVSKAPFIHNEKACKGLLESVQVLKMKADHYGWDNDDGIAKFIALFTRLRSLRWRGGAISRNLSMIHAACPRLEELHLNHSPGPEYSDWVIWPNGDSDIFKDACLAYQGKLRSFAVCTSLTTNDLKTLGENSPTLEDFTMRISLDNMAGLSNLLGTYCRQLKKLEIYLPNNEDVDEDEVITEENYETLGRKGWRNLAESIQIASDELCELTIRGNPDPYEPHHEAMLESVLKIIEFLGKRAREFHLVVPIRNKNSRVSHDLLCRLLNKCVVHSTMLRNLTVCIESGENRFWNDEDRKKCSMRLLGSVKQLEKLQHLHTIDIDRMEEFARRELEDLRGKEPDSKVD